MPSDHTGEPPTIAVIWNPSKTERSELEQALTDAPGTVHWVETSEQDPGTQAAKQAIEAGAELIFAAGGDGTVRAVTEALAGYETPTHRRRPELAIIPLGTGNLLARNLGVPLGDPQAAVAFALEQPATAIDVGWLRVDESAEPVAFAVMAGFGIDAHMISETDDDLKDQVGWAAYLESLGRAVSASDVITIEVALDGEPQKTLEAHTLLVGNCGTVQGGIALIPDADPRDGALDVLMLSADSLAGWLDTLRNMVWDNGVKRVLTAQKRSESSAHVHHDRVKQLAVSLSTPRIVEIDGDELGEARSLFFEVQENAVLVRGASHED